MARPGVTDLWRLKKVMLCVGYYLAEKNAQKAQKSKTTSTALPRRHEKKFAIQHTEESLNSSDIQANIESFFYLAT